MAVEAYQTKQGKRYRASFLFQGQRPSERGFKTIEAAKSWISDERKRLRAEAKAQPQKKTHLDFLDISTKYLKDCAGRMKGANTTRQKTFVIEQFLAFLKSKHDIEIPDTVERSQVREYITDQVASRGEKAANRDLRDLKALFNWAIREELTRDNPAARIEPYAEDAAVKYVPPSEDIDAVLLAAHPWEMDLLTLLYHTAARLSEILGLTWEDVNFERRWLRLWTRKRRGGAKEPRLMPMNDILFDDLQRTWKARDKEQSFVVINPRTGRKFSRNTNSIQKLMARLCARAQVKYFTFHAIRHYIASIASDTMKATPRQIQKFLGHKRLTTTEKYLHDLEAGVPEIGDFLQSRTTRSHQKAKTGSEK